MHTASQHLSGGNVSRPPRARHLPRVRATYCAANTKVGFTQEQHGSGFGNDNSVKGKIIHITNAVRTLLRGNARTAHATPPRRRATARPPYTPCARSPAASPRCIRRSWLAACQTPCVCTMLERRRAVARAACVQVSGPLDSPGAPPSVPKTRPSSPRSRGHSTLTRPVYFAPALCTHAVPPSASAGTAQPALATRSSLSWREHCHDTLPHCDGLRRPGADASQARLCFLALRLNQNKVGKRQQIRHSPIYSGGPRRAEGAPLS